MGNLKAPAPANPQKSMYVHISYSVLLQSNVSKDAFPTKTLHLFKWLSFLVLRFNQESTIRVEYMERYELSNITYSCRRLL